MEAHAAKLLGHGALTQVSVRQDGCAGRLGRSRLAIVGKGSGMDARIRKSADRRRAGQLASTGLLIR